MSDQLCRHCGMPVTRLVDYDGGEDGHVRDEHLVCHWRARAERAEGIIARAKVRAADMRRRAAEARRAGEADKAQMDEIEAAAPRIQKERDALAADLLNIEREQKRLVETAMAAAAIQAPKLVLIEKGGDALPVETLAPTPETVEAACLDVFKRRRGRFITAEDIAASIPGMWLTTDEARRHLRALHKRGQIERFNEAFYYLPKGK